MALVSGTVMAVKTLAKMLMKKMSAKSLKKAAVKGVKKKAKSKIKDKLMGKGKKYRKKSSLRKPGNKMIRNLMSNWLIIKNKSFMIGDKLSDQQCAFKSKIKFEYARENFFKQVKKIVN